MTWIPAFSYPPPDFSLTDPAERLKNWENCIYYWWYEYLKCNDAYEKCCAQKRDPFSQSKRHKLDKLYHHMGDVHSLTFEDWWNLTQRGNELFSERGFNDYFTVIDDYDDLLPHEFNEKDDLVFIRVPLRTQSKRSLKQSFSQLLDELHRGKQGKRTLKTSQALYKVLGRPKIKALKLHLDIYKFWTENHKPYGEGMPDWRIFQEFDLYTEDNREEYSVEDPDSTSKLVMSVIISRHLKRAKALIKNTALGRFPDYQN
ncbi:hypothetical protein [Methyloradius palustris]|uniref:Uncharacterized protein n=1 Tax=Methyloradius palustris TaxID=2778876 RepID=A0A8D5G9V7_9PROT|nr:hypothetical protein [Methyloradius palustris]BCM25716.1 hypothetical protein ZMTM_19750 [Methyloradius palustris]